MKKLIVNDTSIQLMETNGFEYICLTDMVKAKDGAFFVTDWLRNRNTLQYIGIWEQLTNPSFNYGEFAIIKTKAGLNNFKISVKDFVEQTNAISLQAKPGRYGGTYAHKDIAFEFAMWISPEFKIYLIREFQRIKAEKEKAFGWTAKRELAKVNHLIHASSIQKHLVPNEISPEQALIIYASEADVINVALFGHTARAFKKQNPDFKGKIRDAATIEQLICLINLENLNALFIQEGLTQAKRLLKLNQIAIQQLTLLQSKSNQTIENLKKLDF
ncbi:MAG: KilA-N domain-containing protein [Flavobacteriia bacterium]